MNRIHTLGLFTLLALAIAGGLAMVASNANANRPLGIVQGEIASIDVFALVDLALSTDDMAQARQSFEEESNATLRAMQQRFIELQNQLSNMTQDDPAGGQVFQQYQQMQTQLQQASQQASVEYQSLISRQIAEAYRAIYGAVNELAGEQGYVYVFATRSDGELLQTDTITGITQEILARPLVTPPSATDLTEQVRVKLGYPEEVAEDVEQVSPAPTGTTSTTPGTESTEDAVTDEPTDEPTDEE